MRSLGNKMDHCSNYPPSFVSSDRHNRSVGLLTFDSFPLLPIWHEPVIIIDEFQKLDVKKYIQQEQEFAAAYRKWWGRYDGN